MRWVSRLVGGVRALLRKRRLDDDLDEELRAYLEASIDQKVRAGMARDAATRAARAEMGSLEAVKDHTRDVGWETGLEQPVDLKWVSGNYSSALGVDAAMGRRLLPADDRLPSGEPVAVLSDAYWTRRFGRDPSAVGRTVRLRGVPFTIVGVAPRGFFGETAAEAPDVWMPLTTQPGGPSFLWSGHSTTWLRIMTRRRPGVAFEEARASLELVYGRLREEMAAGTESPELRQGVLEGRLVVSDAAQGSSALRDQLSAPLLMLMGIVALVLLIACANVANLMLARAAARRRETAVCLAIGASRFRLVRHGLVEALLLAALGGGWSCGTR